MAQFVLELEIEGFSQRLDKGRIIELCLLDESVGYSVVVVWLDFDDEPRAGRMFVSRMRDRALWRIHVQRAVCGGGGRGERDNDDGVLMLGHWLFCDPGPSSGESFTTTTNTYRF